MHALLDLDILCYEMGSAKDDEGHPLAWPLVVSRVDSRIEQILDSVEAETWQGYITGSGNFRDGIATILPYKGNRNRGDRPFWYSDVQRYLLVTRRAELVVGCEADDRVSIAQSECGDSSIICSRDKDLLMVPGWHYVWNFENSKDTEYVDVAKLVFPHLKKKDRYPFYVEELDGLRLFYSQLLCGDSADNILGLYGVGPKSAAVKRVLEAEDELSMFKEVKEQYELRFGSYWSMFMCENGRLLWMKRNDNDDWYERQKKLLNDCIS